MLAKLFLDPLNNDEYSGNMGINVAPNPNPYPNP